MDFELKIWNRLRRAQDTGWSGFLNEGVFRWVFYFQGSFGDSSLDTYSEMQSPSRGPGKRTSELERPTGRRGGAALLVETCWGENKEEGVFGLLDSVHSGAEHWSIPHCLHDVKIHWNLIGLRQAGGGMGRRYRRVRNLREGRSDFLTFFFWK